MNKLPVNKLPTSAVRFGWHGLFALYCFMVKKGDRHKGSSYSASLSIEYPFRGPSISGSYSQLPSHPSHILTGHESAKETKLPEISSVEASDTWNTSLDSVDRLQTTRLCYPLFPQRSKMSKLKNLAIKVIFLGWWFVLCPPAPCWRETLKKGSFVANV